jgi:V/A-type H+-transporting ATPase subunit A
MGTTGNITGVNGNMITVAFKGAVAQNEVGYACIVGDGGTQRLMSEIVRIRGRLADMQVFEDTRDLRIGDEVDFTGNLLAAELGPGLLTQIYDGLQNPLPQFAEQCGFFLQRGIYLKALNRTTQWAFTPTVEPGKRLTAGEALGTVPEGTFKHRIMVPFALRGVYTVKRIAPAGAYTVEQEIAVLADAEGQEHSVSMMQRWPVKLPITAFAERLKPSETMTTRIRSIDTFFPVAIGGTYCIPGPFGAGKTVLQQTTSRYADVDIVVLAACGERAGEVVETLREFPVLEDPRTGKPLMDRTVIICNTSSMPVAAREASVYTAVTIACYYRQMGLNVLLLADSTSRWAQALRELSGRLEEIPGEEAFPAYLESLIANFYERAGRVRLKDGTLGSVTIGGTVSPAGGNFDEPVTQATLKVVGAFHGLSRARSDARRYPAIDPLESWSKYTSIIEKTRVEHVRGILRQSNDVAQMMKVVGEEGTSAADFTTYLKGTHELLLNMPDEWKFMGRVSWLRDFSATDATGNISAVGSDSFPGSTASELRQKVRLLDLWVSKAFTIGEQNARVRVGNQVVNWGESLFLPGGINQTNAMDFLRLSQPGTQLKEAILPTPMVNFSTGLGKGLSLETYVQAGWQSDYFPPVSSYWSTAVVGPGATAMGVPTPRHPSNGGQYGAALRYAPQGSEINYGAYFMNYHDKAPVLSVTGGGPSYSYLSDRKMYGLSANFPLGNWAIGAELSYRPKDAVSLNSSVGSASAPGGACLDNGHCYVETGKYQLGLTGLLSLTPSDNGEILHLLGADTATLMAEAVVIR